MPGADPERSAPGVFLWGGCQNRLRLSFGERCVRVAGHIEMSEVALPGRTAKSSEYPVLSRRFGQIEPAAALAPTKNKQVGCQGNFCGYLPVVPEKSTEKQPKKLKNSIRKPATGQSWQRQTYLPNRAAYVAIDILENFTYEKWVSLPNRLVIQIVQC